ncbi:molybdate ABC transporter permease subunit [Alteromonas oceanisediminis]|uniref:molybdate ABC transporter permease subunit n=1 Tax=Alteromonas oceanisediminis TaxID=2836180 RepID=UPI001BD9D15A|nr:molybdate ABC transporter permease subunit [Alteromonas oceanisediminis]MBT0587337.1 molybdate ABC transporter permease subunit [Alteromonas oceanisediminis]
MDWQSIQLTLKLAFLSSVVLIVIATPLAWWLARWQHPLRPVVHAVIALPLVLPPTVLGFYLLVAFSPNTALGGFYVSATGSTLAFSFTGILIGSLVYSLPFAVQPLYNAFEHLDKRFIDVARTFHMTRWQQFRHVVLPLTKSAFVTAAGLSFAHTLGEFGVVLMIGGNIPGETKVVSIALFDHVESLQYADAHRLALLLLIFSLVLLSLLYRFNRRQVLKWN